MNKITVIRYNNHVIATIGNKTRKSVLPSITLAKRLETRLTFDKEFAEKWMKKSTEILVQDICVIPIIRKHKSVVAYDHEGNVLRTYECRNVQCAVELETKLNTDIKFAEMWVRSADPESPYVRIPHRNVREWAEQ